MSLEDELLQALQQSAGRTNRVLVLNPEDAKYLEEEISKIRELSFTPNRLEAFLGAPVRVEPALRRGRVGISYLSAAPGAPTDDDGPRGADGVIILEEYSTQRPSIFDLLDGDDE